MTTPEWIALKATLLTTWQQEYSCSHCLSLYQGRSDREKMVEARRAAKACQTPHAKPFMHIGREVGFLRCPGNFVDQGCISLIEMHRAFRESGILPYAGCLADQPNKVMEAFRVIDLWQSERAVEAAEEAKRRQRARAPGRNSGR